jgi:hypothetical protein
MSTDLEAGAVIVGEVVSAGEVVCKWNSASWTKTGLSRSAFTSGLALELELLPRSRDRPEASRKTRG